MSITKDQIIGAIADMSVMDVAELVAKMEEKFGVSAIKNTAVITEHNTADVVEEKTEFDVILQHIGTNKVAVIKTVRSATGLGLKEAKELVESAPGALLKEGINKNDAEVLKKSLEEAGAMVEIK